MNIYEVVNKMKSEHKTIFDMNLRVTFYARVSTLTEEQENSVENQIRYFTDFIKNNINWTYVEGYVDRVRAESVKNRLSFQRMIADAKNDTFDIIITKEVSRFARNTVDSLTYSNTLLRFGVGVFFENDNICTIDSDCELRLSIMSSIAADEVRKLSERVRWGHKRAIDSGNVLGNSRIFGYDKKDCKLIINEKEAEMVSKIFELYGTGKYSANKICKVLEAEGYRGRNGTVIHHNTIIGIIANPKYKGYYCGNKVKITDYRTKEQKFLPEEEWVMYKDESGEIVPAIVSEELWDRCNVFLRERSEAVKSRGRSFKDKSVFTGKIWCKNDEVPYWRTSYSNSVAKGSPKYQWICSEKRKHGAASCKSFSIMESELYAIMSSQLKEITDNVDDCIKTFLESYSRLDNSSADNKRIIELKAQLDKEKTKKEKLLDLYVDEVITSAEFKERNKKLETTVNELNKEIKNLEKKSGDKSSYEKELRKIEKYLKDMYNPDREMTKEQVDEMVSVMIDNITVEPLDERTMNLEIRLKSGLESNYTHVRNGERYGCRSGQIIKKMIESYENSAQ